MLGLQVGKQCFCGNSYGKHGLSDVEDCNYLCSGNPKEISGGSGINSVYAIDEGIVHCLLVPIDVMLLINIS